MRSNLRWCSDGFEISCWNGDIVRLAFIIDAHDREIIAWHAVANAGISGSMVRDMMLEAVESRFAAIRAPHALEWLTDNGSAYTAHGDPGLRDRAQSRPCFTPVQSPESNGISESFVKTFKRDYVRVNPFRMRSPHSGRSPDGSRTTTKTILIPGSKCAPQGSSSELKRNSRRVRSNRGNSTRPAPCVGRCVSGRPSLAVRTRGPPPEADQREMPERRHRAALDHAHAAVAASAQSRQPRPAEFRPPAEPARQRREPLLERAAQPALGADVIDQDDLAARPAATRANSSSVASGSGTAVMTYCATTTSNDAVGEAQMLARPSPPALRHGRACARSTRSCALRSIGSE